MTSSILTIAETEASTLVTLEKTTYIYSWNSTEFAVNLTTSVRPEGDSPDSSQGLRWSTLFLCVLVVATAFGNILLCLAVVTERRLQNMTNYFLTSLAVADLLVALLVMPLGLVNELFGYFPLNPPTCVAWATADVLLCTASIWHMATMSVDRYCSIRCPLRYGRLRTRTSVVLRIAFVWIVSTAICVALPIYGALDSRNIYSDVDHQCVPRVRYFVIYGSIFAFYIPLVIMIVTYALTVRHLIRNSRTMDSFRRRESVASAILGAPVPVTTALSLPGNNECKISADGRLCAPDDVEKQLDETFGRTVKPSSPSSSPKSSLTRHRSRTQLLTDQRELDYDDDELFLKDETSSENGRLELYDRLGLDNDCSGRFADDSRGIGNSSSSASAAVSSPPLEVQIPPFKTVSTTLTPESCRARNHVDDQRDDDEEEITGGCGIIGIGMTSYRRLLSSEERPKADALHGGHGEKSCVENSSVSHACPAGFHRRRRCMSEDNGTGVDQMPSNHIGVNGVAEDLLPLTDHQTQDTSSRIPTKPACRQKTEVVVTKRPNRIRYCTEPPGSSVSSKLVPMQCSRCMCRYTSQSVRFAGVEKCDDDVELTREKRPVCIDSRLLTPTASAFVGARVQQPDDVQLSKLTVNGNDYLGPSGEICSNQAVATTATNNSGDEAQPTSSRSPDYIAPSPIVAPVSRRVSPSIHKFPALCATCARQSRETFSSSFSSIDQQNEQIAYEDRSPTTSLTSDRPSPDAVGHCASNASARSRQSSTADGNIPPPRRQRHSVSAMQSCSSIMSAQLAGRRASLSASRSRRASSMERRATRVLGVMFFVFVVMWSPFFIANIISVACDSEGAADNVDESSTSVLMSTAAAVVVSAAGCLGQGPGAAAMTSMVWLGYTSSLANPVIYTVFSSSFRSAFIEILTLRRWRRGGSSSTSRLRQRSRSVCTAPVAVNGRSGNRLMTSAAATATGNNMKVPSWTTRRHLAVRRHDVVQR